MIDYDNEIEREKEKKNIVDIAGYFFCVIIFLSGVIYYIYPHIEIVDVMYDLEIMQKKKEALTETNNLLALEAASLKRFARIENIAKKELGLNFLPHYKANFLQ